MFTIPVPAPSIQGNSRANHLVRIDKPSMTDFAARMKYLCDVCYPAAVVIRVVLDNPEGDGG